MISRKEYELARAKAIGMMQQAGISLTSQENTAIEVADFGLGNLSVEGAQIATLAKTDRIALRIIILFPWQTLPEHQHPPACNDLGKEETLRCITGTVYVYTPGEITLKGGFVPPGKETVYSVRHETALQPGEQCTLQPGTKHWFQAGPQGAVFYSISTCLSDAIDQFTNPSVVRVTKIKD
jgi:D-lyxose ketol-isomerase